MSLACLEPEIRKVICKVTYFCRTRSHVEATHMVYMPLTFLTQQTMGTKAIISLACIDLEIRWVTWKVTWPWRAKSRVKAMHLAYMPLTLLTQETMQNKNSHVSGMYRARDKIGHLWGQVTLTYKVKRQGHILFHLLYRNLTIETNRIFKIQSITRMWQKTVLSSPEQQKAKFIHENIKIP